jgi:hypothetical protein
MLGAERLRLFFLTKFHNIKPGKKQGLTFPTARFGLYIAVCKYGVKLAHDTTPVSVQTTLPHTV